jgi:hypothetical protein
LVRASACHAEGREFESRHSRHKGSDNMTDLQRWIAMHNSCLDHEGKVIPEFWKKNNGLLAQLDRASDYESEGRGFDSLTVHQVDK